MSQNITIACVFVLGLVAGYATGITVSAEKSNESWNKGFVAATIAASSQGSSDYECRYGQLQQRWNEINLQLGENNAKN